MPALYVFPAAPARFYYVPGISAVGSEVNVYTVQLISCTLLSEPKINMIDPTICLGLGRRLKGGLTKSKGQQLGTIFAVHRESFSSKLFIREDTNDNQYGPH